MLIRAVSLLFVVMAALPAKADIILSYHLSSFNGPDTAPIPDNLPTGPALSNFSISVGEVKYLQVAIEATLPVIGGQANWTGTNGLIAFGFAFNYPSSLVSQPFITPMIPTLSQNWPNARSESPFSTGHPITFTQYNMGSTAITGLTLGNGLLANNGQLSPTVIATFKLVGVSTGSGQFSCSPLQPLTPGLSGLSDGVTTLDSIIFAPPHANFPISFQVSAVPEPSSFAMMGLAAAIGWRRLRR
jgi:hypothetical protein